jgi:hypothetical protein
MKKLALIYALLLAASPAAAQLATSSSVQQSVLSTPTVAPQTGVFCIEEMTATFCNVVTGPNTSGYGSPSVSTPSTSSSGAASSGLAASSGGGANSPSILPCPSEPPFDELCN